MANQTEYRNCPECGLNYITGSETAYSVCISAIKPYRGKYCENCGCKSGLYKLCWSCHKTKDMSANEKRAVAGYRTDNGMLGQRTKNVCEICGASTYGRLCGRCYMSIHYRQEDTDK